MAISWTHREDYGRAGFAMLSVLDRDGASVGRQAVFYSVALLAVSVAPSFLGMAGVVYLIGSAAASSALLVTALKFSRERSATRARALFMTSNIYLLVMMVLLVALVRG
jgi:heme O synthase-like polyprenyltransferase